MVKRKTIKELEKLNLDKDNFEYGYWLALKDVLGLIDEMEAYAGYPQPNIIMIDKEELKSRIEG